MLPAGNRLRDGATFRTTVRRGRRTGGAGVVLHLAPGPAGATEPPRIGLVVSRAVGPAVTRNLVKRRLRHLLRGHVAALPPGSVLVVRALPAAAELPFPALGAELDGALGRLLQRVRT